MTTRVDVLGVAVSTVNMADAVKIIGGWVEERERHYVCVTGVHGVMEANRSPELLAIHNESGLTVPDGMPLVWAGHYAGVENMGRVYGPDLTLELAQLAAHRGWSCYFYGGAEGVPEMLAKHLRASAPGLEVAGCWSPPFRALTLPEEDAVVDRINNSGADIVFVGLSTPKQERWMARFRDQLYVPALIGVGAAFDLLTDRVPQAPAALQRVGLEWAFRFAMEPKRLWKRYTRNNPEFVMNIIRKPPFLIDVAPSRVATGQNDQSEKFSRHVGER